MSQKSIEKVLTPQKNQIRRDVRKQNRKMLMVKKTYFRIAIMHQKFTKLFPKSLQYEKLWESYNSIKI